VLRKVFDPHIRVDEKQPRRERLSTLLYVSYIVPSSHSNKRRRDYLNVFECSLSTLGAFVYHWPLIRAVGVGVVISASLNATYQPWAQLFAIGRWFDDLTGEASSDCCPGCNKAAHWSIAAKVHVLDRDSSIH
jgi:hypothetical protein